MPKLKTVKAMKKRVKRTAKKVFLEKACKRHRLLPKSKRQKHTMRRGQGMPVNKTNAHEIQRMLVK